MALATVLDFLLDWPGRATLDMVFGDETSGQGSGIVLVKELRPPLWHLRAESKVLKPNEFAEWQARLESLENGKRLFIGRDLTRCYPILYPNGTWPTGGSFDGTGAIVSVGTLYKSLVLDNLPAGYVGSVGDLISFPYASGSAFALHRVVEPFLANGSGVTNEFEVRPHIRTGAADNDVVAVYLPSCRMRMLPGTLQAEQSLSGRGTISFEAIQAL